MEQLTGPNGHGRSPRAALPLVVTLLAAAVSCTFAAPALAESDTAIDSGPGEGSTINTATPIFTFSAAVPGSTFECSVDGLTFAACMSPYVTASLSDGTHTFEVRALDTPATPDPTPASRTFTVDTTGPVVTIESGPSGPTNDTTPRFNFSADDPGSTFACRIDTDPFGPCEGPGSSHIVDQPLPDGSYTFEVQATDTAGNSGAATRSFTVDTDPPNTTIDAGPGQREVIPTSTPTFGFISSEEPSTFECSVDDDDFAPCPNPYTLAAPLPDEIHSFRVRAIDAAGNRDPNPAQRLFTVDTTPPDTAIDSGPVGTVSDSAPTFTFSGADAERFECRIDSDPFAPCSGPGDAHTPAPLTDGEHTFAVRAFDAAGNVDPTPAARSFTVDTSLPPDTTPPDTTITKRPKRKLETKGKHAKVEVSFSSEPGAAFSCRLDDGKYRPCTSPYVAKAKSKGGKGRRHRIAIRATDSAGNTGAPAVVGFRVQRAPRLGSGRAERTVVRALRRHGFAGRVVGSLNADCDRRARAAFGCRFSSRFPGYRLRGRGEVELRARLSYRFRVRAQGVRLTLTDENESRRSR